MEKGYFAASWEDVKNSQGWVGKVFLLALISLIPVFGIIVVYGYLYGWTREMAWNIHRPLPARIFGNEDGQLYRRGGYMFLFTLIIGLIAGILSSFSGGGSLGALQDLQALQNGGSVYNDTVNIVYSPFAGLASLLSLAFGIVTVFWSMIAFSRISIYNTFGSAFNFKQIWAMFRYDGFGLLRIFGIVLLVGLIGGVVASFLLVPGTLILFAAMFQAFSSSATVEYVGPAASVGFGVILFILGFFVAQLFSVFADMIQARCLGYWLRQFDVAQWGGPEDLLPFQRMGYTSADQVRNLQQQQAWGFGQQAPMQNMQQPIQGSYPAQGYQQPMPYVQPMPEQNAQQTPDRDSGQESAQDAQPAVTQEAVASCDIAFETPSSDPTMEAEEPQASDSQDNRGEE